MRVDGKKVFYTASFKCIKVAGRFVFTHKFTEYETTHIIYSAYLSVRGKLETIPADFSQEAGYTLDSTLIYHRADTETNNFLHTFTPLE